MIQSFENCAKNIEQLVIMFKEKIFYNRVIIAALNNEMQRIPFIHPFPFMQIINPFLISKISANRDKMDEL